MNTKYIINHSASLCGNRTSYIINNLDLDEVLCQLKCNPDIDDIAISKIKKQLIENGLAEIHLKNDIDEIYIIKCQI